MSVSFAEPVLKDRRHACFATEKILSMIQFPLLTIIH